MLHIIYTVCTGHMQELIGHVPTQQRMQNAVVCINLLYLHFIHNA